LKRGWFDEIPAPKRRPLPITVLTTEEITRIHDQTHNLKHWTILATFYATGLRCDELRKLKVADIDGPRMMLHIRSGKGGIPQSASGHSYRRAITGSTRRARCAGR
jgi:integrase